MTKYSYRDTKSFTTIYDDSSKIDQLAEPEPIGPVMLGFKEVIEHCMKLKAEGKDAEAHEYLRNNLWCMGVK